MRIPENITMRLSKISDLEPKIVVTSLEQNVWSDIKNNAALSLERLKIGSLLEPTLFLLQQLIANSINVLHYDVFKQIIQNDFGLEDVMNDADFKDIFNSEINEHGDKNIAKYCTQNNLHVILSFPQIDDVIATISAPSFCGSAIQSSRKLIETLGYRFEIQKISNHPDFYTGLLFKHYADINLVKPPELLPLQDEKAYFNNIFSTLSYGIICFNNLGIIQTLSSSLLEQINLEASDASIEFFSKSIPERFYNDVIWGFALEEPHGKFENYRVRIKTNNKDGSSVLFNVSGFRDQHSVIQTLWQKISLDGKSSSSLSEGSLLHEARIHNITRNYVPQLVEQKAREVVRLGGNLLGNEECDIAILFCDIVGFTPYVEKNENEESIIHTLNSILRRISTSVKKHGGFIDKFMGDCIMVLFREPHNAVIAALEMQNHSADINVLRERSNLDRLLLRIGIHWGKVVIGNVGTPERLDWTAIGDVVNTAARIEKTCRPECVLISQSMREVIEPQHNKGFKYGETFSVTLKGKTRELEVCYVYSVD